MKIKDLFAAIAGRKMNDHKKKNRNLLTKTFREIHKYFSEMNRVNFCITIFDSNNKRIELGTYIIIRINQNH